MNEITRDLYRVWKRAFEQLNLKFIQNRRCQDLGELRDDCRRAIHDLKDYEAELRSELGYAMETASFGWYLDEIQEVHDLYEKYIRLYDEIDNQIQLWEILKHYRKETV